MNRQTLRISGILRATAWGAGAGAIVFFAASRVQAPRPGRMAAIVERPRFRDNASGIRAQQSTMPTDREWSEAQEFLRKYSPNRLNQFQNLTGPHERIKRLLLARYARLMTMKRSPNGESVYNASVRQLQLEDQVFGICLALKQQQGDPQGLRAELKNTVAALFDTGIQVRQLRITQLETALKKQASVLETEKKSRDLRIEQQYNFISSHGVLGAYFGPRSAPPKRIPAPQSQPTDGQ
ncbi:MAG TPA: hypothetical protein VFC78_20480 [Tepidisphaeraceae bacterium]|nr:hypothetical protein [Tepidisphaeraceae bacterium]